MTFITPELLTCLGIAFAIGLSAHGSCSASAASGMYMTRYNHMGQSSFTTKSWWNFMKPFIPIVISGVLAIYGFIVAVLLGMQLKEFDDSTSVGTGYKYLAAGLSVGLACSSSGSGLYQFLLDYVLLYSSELFLKQDSKTNGHSNGTGSSATTTTMQSNPEVQPLLFESSNHEKVKVFPEPNVHFCMTLVYLEAIGLYGLIVAIILISL